MTPGKDWSPNVFLDFLMRRTARALEATELAAFDVAFDSATDEPTLTPMAHVRSDVGDGATAADAQVYTEALRAFTDLVTDATRQRKHAVYCVQRDASRGDGLYCFVRLFFDVDRRPRGAIATIARAHDGQAARAKMREIVSGDLLLKE